MLLPGRERMPKPFEQRQQIFGMAVQFVQEEIRPSQLAASFISQVEQFPVVAQPLSGLTSPKRMVWYLRDVDPAATEISHPGEKPRNRLRFAK